MRRPREPANLIDFSAYSEHVNAANPDGMWWSQYVPPCAVGKTHMILGVNF